MKCTCMANAKILRSGPNATYIPLAFAFGFCVGVTQILCFALGVMQILAFLDTNMLVSPTRHCGVGGLSWHQQRRCMTKKRQSLFGPM